MKSGKLSGALLLALVLAPAAAFASADTGIAKVIHGMADQFQAAAELLTTVSYLIGAGFAVQSALKFKEHNDNPQQVKLSRPITLALVAGLLLALPSWMTVVTTTPFGETSAPYKGGELIFK